MTPPRDSISEELESLVTRFARFASRIAHDRGLHHEDIDELLQELRVRFWRARKDGLRDLSANYVRRDAVSAALDIIRRRRVDRNVSLEETDAGPRPLASATAGPAELLDQSELARSCDHTAQCATWPRFRSGILHRGRTSRQTRPRLAPLMSARISPRVRDSVRQLAGHFFCTRMQA